MALPGSWSHGNILKRRRTDEAAPGRPSPRILRTDDIAARVLDANAVHVVDRLQRFGHAAYLVGGCVRDLLLKREPKDYDVATSARPRQIRRVFRNCRIIGRRFKLAHVVFGEDIIETSTFRTIPSASSGAGLGDGDLLITSDNEFGTAEEDAQRRDFTVNALFYDPARREVIDYVGGLEDLGAGLIRTVGDPQIRFREDPVRILRAIKFASRLDFQFEAETFQAMRDCATDLEKGAPPRVLEEILRLLRSGKAESAFRLLDDCGSLAVILPEIDAFLRASRRAGDGEDEIIFASLRELDRRFAEGEDPSAGFCLAVLFSGPLRLALSRRSREWKSPMDLLSVFDDVLEGFSERTRLSRRDSGNARRFALLRQRLERSGRRRQRPLALVRQEGFDEGLDLLAIECATRRDPELRELYLEWHERRESARRESGYDRSEPANLERLIGLPSSIDRPEPVAREEAPRRAVPLTREAPAEKAALAPPRRTREPQQRAADPAEKQVESPSPAPALVPPPTAKPAAARRTPTARPAESASDAAAKPSPVQPNPGKLEELPFGYGVFEPPAPPPRAERPLRKRR
ncbi:MAG: polynucleotide adenylyltransferase PcnB [Planctomycetes bacterium]|nr:polynucleotide adenylyltransferase PcnB [Planctomycetota bacterium]